MSRQRKKEEKYERILQAAMDIITEKGIQRTTISEIANRADVAQGTFYLYFSSKNALVPAMAERLVTITLNNLKEKVCQTSDFWTSLQQYIDEVYSMTEQHREILIICYAGAAFDYTMAMWEHIYSSYYEWFGHLLQTAIDSGMIEADTNVEWTAKLLINMVEGEAERYYIGDDKETSAERSKEKLYEFIRRSLDPTYPFTDSLKEVLQESS